MANQTAFVAAADYFLWRRRGDSGDLTSHTTHTRLENFPGTTTPQNGLIGDALKIFHSKKKSIQRSTGGRINGEPYQIVFYGKDRPGWQGPPETRIKVRFWDYRWDSNGRLLTPKPVLHTKVVLPGELAEPFSVEARPEVFHPLVADFGRGIVPVHVMEFGTDAEGNGLAYFIDDEELTRLVQEPKGTRHIVRLYRIPSVVLRMADTHRAGGRKSEYDVAKDNDAHLRKAQGFVVPEAFAWGDPLLVPAAGSPARARTLLQEIICRKDGASVPAPAQPVVPERRDTQEMLPFGIFETE